MDLIRKLLFALIMTVSLIWLNSCTKNADGTVTVIPIAPTNLKATTFSTTAINLSWTDNSTNEDGFKIERKNGGSDFSLIATLAADKIVYKDSLLTPHTTYTYRVYSFNTAGKSITYTNLDSATTDASQTFVTIGAQVWTNKNLEVSKYRNGDIIPQVTDASTWASLTTGAWCYYNNDPANGAKYGKLYNWYAVHDNRGLAPAGWHIPSDAEWTILTTYLGGELVAGAKMKEAGTLNWQSPNSGTNESGFSGLPGGYLNDLGRFSNIGFSCRWWSATAKNDGGSPSAWFLNLNLNLIPGISMQMRSWYPNVGGFSVRCIKD